VLLSYGVVMGVGAGLVRETSSLMLGHYFKRRREFVEMVVQTGAGVGIALFSVLYKEAVGKLGWRLGLQAVTGVLALAFFLGILYRSASLYHPQRRAILHLKNQRKKVKEKMSVSPPLLDFSPLRLRAVQMLLLASCTGALGVYTPVFYLALQGYKEGLEDSALVLMQTFLGFATALGCVGFGLVVVRPSEQCLISRQYLCQAAMVGVGVSLLALSAVQGYHGYVLFVWLYGVCLGGFLYSLKMFTMERVRARYFTRAWGFVQGAEAIPVLLGVPITGYINQSHPKAGYYFSFLSTMLGAALLFLVGVPKRHPPPPAPAICSCNMASPAVTIPVRPHLPKSISFATTLDLPDPEEALTGYSHRTNDNFRVTKLCAGHKVPPDCQNVTCQFINKHTEFPPGGIGAVKIGISLSEFPREGLVIHQSLTNLMINSFLFADIEFSLRETLSFCSIKQARSTKPAPLWAPLDLGNHIFSTLVLLDHINFQCGKTVVYSQLLVTTPIGLPLYLLVRCFNIAVPNEIVHAVASETRIRDVTDSNPVVK
ncbi:hypothetical protein L9F63_009668, partial [Diploptera punctata]